jgi:hypothetical protein
VLDILEGLSSYTRVFPDSSIKEQIPYDVYTRPIVQYSEQCNMQKDQLIEILTEESAMLNDVPINEAIFLYG